MNNEESVDYNEKVMGIPKCVKPSELLKELGKVELVAPEPRSGKCEGYGH